MRYCAIALIVIFFTSCEKDVDLNLKSANPVLVVDAQIEDGQPPIVVLTKSLGFFSNINAVHYFFEMHFTYNGTLFTS